MKLATTLAATACLMSTPLFAMDNEQRAADSRAAVQALVGQLKGELQAAMEQGGPVAAIQVCNTKADTIAENLSQEKGMEIGRTSLKVRNTKNEPDTWERAVMEKFEVRKMAGEDPTKMEFFEVVEANGKKSFRYMKAIPTAEKPCLACHGAELKPEVSAKLDELYPADKARGFKAGDIRGAFTITSSAE
ncbi:MAG: DUF3365 domain-containing protein [Gammaproteobacteria bacterium]|nr:DUF3365 domain-containing protein [Gammaproteobacteria bacterium]MBU1653276.1 DUF3365 domain-containing protein [Gammaproteobacteria bacterium]MBU1961502.1 DUF3365 domain-containing protein [Gammaproteobacteria bacterium]